MTWEPTNELRWKVTLTPSSNVFGGTPRKNALLQQKWQDTDPEKTQARKALGLDGYGFEWRDVPFEEVEG